MPEIAESVISQEEEEDEFGLRDGPNPMVLNATEKPQTAKYHQTPSPEKAPGPRP